MNYKLNDLFKWADEINISDIDLPRNEMKILNKVELFLNNYNISYLPQELFLFSNLTELSIVANNLERIPQEIDKLKNLTILDFSYNKLMNLPESIVNLTKLKELNLEHNKSLILTIMQKNWISNLKNNGCKVFIDDDILAKESNNKLIINKGLLLPKQTKKGLFHNKLAQCKINIPIQKNKSKKNIIGDFFDGAANTMDSFSTMTKMFNNLLKEELENQQLEIKQREIERQAILENLSRKKDKPSVQKKYLEILKISLSIEDRTIIDIVKVQLYNTLTNNEINIIFDLIEKLKYNEAIVIIDQHISSNTENILKNNIVKSKYESKGEEFSQKLCSAKNSESTNIDFILENIYSNGLKDILQPNFTKIIRYATNNQSDEMSEFLSKNGKKYKALYYSAFEEVIHELDNTDINIIDWNCEQGIASSLLIDFIKEKQLNININQIILIENDDILLERAVIHVKTLKKSNCRIISIKKEFDKIGNEIYIHNNVTINFVSNIFKHNLNYKFYDLFTKSENCKQYFISVKDNDKKELEELHKFYNYFEMFPRELIKQDNSKIGKYKNNKMIFKVSFDQQLDDDLLF